MPPLESKAGQLAAVDGALALEHSRAWLKWAAAQIEACLAQDSQGCSELLRALAQVLPAAAGPAAAAPGAAGREMSAVVIAVQAHDRVMQGLVHVAESLHALHSHLGDTRRAGSADAWHTLRAARFGAFSMAEERALFARMLAHQDEVEHEAELTPEDTVELFMGDHGLPEP